jgi:Fuc2NAc and GlcNAc transferase
MFPRFDSWFLMALAALASALLTGVFRRYALTRQLIDVPGARSAHRQPTPRGGGAAVVLVIVVTVIWLALSSGLNLKVASALLGGGVLVAAVGFWDDHGHVGAHWRLLVHAAAAIWAVAWVGGIPPLPVGQLWWQPGWLGVGLASFGIVWLLNLYNFMDGIDGIAGSEAIFVSAGAALIIASAGGSEMITFLLVVAGACLGFLIWNWPPAKVFMGDVGSGFLGYVLGVSALASIDGRMTLWSWIILLGVFLVDATLTLSRRVLRRARWWDAHRTHAYQHAVRRWASHTRVSVGAILINILWLFPLAWAASVWPAQGWWLTAAALLPLCFAAISLGAGRPESQP